MRRSVPSQLIAAVLTSTDVVALTTVQQRQWGLVVKLTTQLEQLTRWLMTTSSRLTSTPRSTWSSQLMTSLLSLLRSPVYQAVALVQSLALMTWIVAVAQQLYALACAGKTLEGLSLLDSQADVVSDVVEEGEQVSAFLQRQQVLQDRVSRNAKWSSVVVSELPSSLRGEL